ncbi:hypothetical protein GCM10009037_15570 [Halarchaeum grantii]|uniref:Uncharacterized protein n=1 Tax=Halarchaeum grantii TaxID=1193105 RepID=A0A830F2G4_9EURY|nr:hypothetical protein [Halarchaeum grantii]GGL32784.1 hypothetical protein GCM10009037_15570 [Halarchaeum grantii]
MSDPVARAPTRLGATLAVLAGVLGVAVAAVGGLYPVTAAIAGTAALAAGVRRGRRRDLAVGAVLLALAAVLLGAFDAGPLPALAVAAAALFAWDVGENALSLGEQLGVEARTRDAELVHAAASAGVLALAGAAVYGVALGGFGGRPVGALVALLVGALVLAWTLR